MNSALLLLLSLLVSVSYGYSPCARRYVRGESQPEFMVCVCNATYCDDFPPLGTLDANSAAVYI
uniref:Glucosylceramidase n=1 Tax=Plectus sambesii TaxID=2011161 RepID=A0A914V2J1_9BILA